MRSETRKKATLAGNWPGNAPYERRRNFSKSLQREETVKPDGAQRNQSLSAAMCSAGLMEPVGHHLHSLSSRPPGVLITGETRQSPQPHQVPRTGTQSAETPGSIRPPFRLLKITSNRRQESLGVRRSSRSSSTNPSRNHQGCLPSQSKRRTGFLRRVFYSSFLHSFKRKNIGPACAQFRAERDSERRRQFA